jgi:excisionase family DNA binding protein
MSEKLYSTGEAARATGVSRATLQEWIRLGKFRPPQRRDLGGKIAIRLWTEADLERLRRRKAEIYWQRI